MIPPCHYQYRKHLEEATAAADTYLVDHLQFMREQEETTYQVPASANYLAPSYATVTHTDRRAMLDWSYEIVGKCSISREISCIGIQYFDRFLCTSSPRAKVALASRREFQLGFITCLVIALKCRAGMQVEPEFVSDVICQNMYDEWEIIGMERDILSALQWRLNGPSPHEFIAGMVALLPPDASQTTAGGLDSSTLAERLTTLADSQAELAMLDYSTALRHSPSSIAYTALMTAMQSIDADVFRPLHRLTWMSCIDVITNRKWRDHSAAPQPSSVSKEVILCCRTVSTSTPVSPGTAAIQPEEIVSGLGSYLCKAIPALITPTP